MDNAQSSFCCGVGEIGGFCGDGFLGNPKRFTEHTGLTIEQEQAELDRRIGVCVTLSRGLITATTLAETQKIAGEWLKARGFKDTLHFRGRDTEGRKEIILWTKVLKEV